MNRLQRTTTSSPDGLRRPAVLARRFWWAAVVAMLTILAVELFVPAREQAQTPDEANHLLGGVRYWKYGDFGTNPEHPPLAKLVAALPLLGIPCPPAAPFTQFFKMENFGSGTRFSTPTMPIPCCGAGALPSPSSPLPWRCWCSPPVARCLDQRPD